MLTRPGHRFIGHLSLSFPQSEGVRRSKI